MAFTPVNMDDEMFKNGMTFEAFASSMKKHRNLIETLYQDARIDADMVRAFRDAAARHGGALRIGVLTEHWCGDSTVNLPIIARLADAVPEITLRIFIAKHHKELGDAYGRDGIGAIPVVSLFDSRWNEIGRWVERPAAAGPHVDAWLAGYPELASLSGSEDPEDKRQVADIYDRLLQVMSDWYREGLWSETMRELRALVA